jgi:site-specific DNA-methyltransferase (cytosine-N4-specific)
LWLNIGDSYNGSGGCHKKDGKNDTGFQGKNDYLRGGKPISVDNLKPKDLIGIPFMLAFSLRNAGWYLRQDIIWHKPNPMPESVTDRCTKSHEYIFLLSKSQKYYFDYEAISEPCADQNRTNYQSGSRSNGENKDRNDNDLGERSKLWKPRTKNCQYDGQQPNTMHLRREQGLPDKEYTVRNKRDVWSVNVKPDSVAHFATYPEELITPCILAGSPNGGVVLDPFMGSGTTARVARKLNRHFVGFELNPEYCIIIDKKIQVSKDLFY